MIDIENDLQKHLVRTYREIVYPHIVAGQSSNISRVETIAQLQQETSNLQQDLKSSYVAVLSKNQKDKLEKGEQLSSTKKEVENAIEALKFALEDHIQETLNIDVAGLAGEMENIKHILNSIKEEEKEELAKIADALINEILTEEEKHSLHKRFFNGKDIIERLYEVFKKYELGFDNLNFFTLNDDTNDLHETIGSYDFLTTTELTLFYISSILVQTIHNTLNLSLLDNKTKKKTLAESLIDKYKEIKEISERYAQRNTGRIRIIDFMELDKTQTIDEATYTDTLEAILDELSNILGVRPIVISYQDYLNLSQEERDSNFYLVVSRKGKFDKVVARHEALHIILNQLMTANKRREILAEAKRAMVQDRDNPFIKSKLKEGFEIGDISDSIAEEYLVRKMEGLPFGEILRWQARQQ
jgi:hypothetical protein